MGIASILAYHLLPGIPILLIAILFSNPVWGFGLPIFLALMLAILFGLIPVQLGIMTFYAHRQGKKIGDIIGFRGGFSTDAITDTMKYIILFLGFTLNGLLGPYVEELYFRGFLLPRMTKLGSWAPFVNGVLFSVYHFFSPWENVTRILVMTPYLYAVWYKRNIVIGMVVHLGLNLVGMIAMAAAVL